MGRSIGKSMRFSWAEHPRGARESCLFCVKNETDSSDLKTETK